MRMVYCVRLLYLSKWNIDSGIGVFTLKLFALSKVYLVYFHWVLQNAVP